VSPEAFHQIADLLPEPHLLVSGGGTIRAANPATRDRLGLSPDAIQGRPLAEVVIDPPDEVQSYLRRCGRSWQLVLGALTVSGSPPLPCRAEGALIRPAGAEASILLRLVPKQSAIGQFVALNQRIDELGREIHRRHQAERMLGAERERLRITLASIGDAVISTDAEGRVTFLNGVAETLTGWPLAEAIGRPLPEVFRIINEHTRVPAENPALRALREGTVVGLANHTVLIARDGTERPIDDSAAPIQDGAAAPVGAVLVFRDVTERKRAEEARGRLAAIVESSTDAIVSKSLDGIILTWNSGAERLFDYTAQEAVGQSITLITPPDRLEEERVLLNKLCRGERLEPFETVRVDKHGQPIDISLAISPIRDRDGNVIGASKVARNITARKRAEAALRESEARHRVLADLAATTQMLTDPAEIMAIAARLLAELLGADRCAYAEVEAESVYVITGDYATGVPSIVGRWPVAAFGQEHHRLMRANQPYVVEDADTDPRITPDDLSAYRATNIQAVICVPLHKGGRFTAAMAVHQKTPRRWTPAEIDLVTTYVSRCQEVLERAAAERALAASRSRLEYAVKVAGIGFWYCDLPFDVLEWDERVKEHFWLPPDAVVTIKTFYDQLHPDDRARTRTAIERSINDRASYDIQYRTVDRATGAINSTALC
jgi:PAS domain S-box-containing protein